MQLYKAHGAGNDFVVVPDPDDRVALDADAVVALCDRRVGIGADGVLRIAPDEHAHAFMDYRNGQDGAAVETCGNGLRVVAAHLVDHGWTTDHELRIATRAGLRTATVATGPDGRVVEVDVDMGPPDFTPAAVGVTGQGIRPANADAEGGHVLHVGDEDLGIVTVSMGNPHAVLLVEDVADAPVRTLGPTIEHHPAFAHGTNVEFARVTGRQSLDLRVWERGVGETLACGSGICATVATLVALGLLDAGVEVDVTVPGGRLRARWDGGADDPVHLVGPTMEVATVQLGPALQGTLPARRPEDSATAAAAGPTHETTASLT